MKSGLFAFCSLGLVLSGFCSVVLTRPAAVELDGRPAGAAVAVEANGSVVLAGVESASFVTLRWQHAFAAEAKTLGGMWERTYGDSAWRKVRGTGEPLDWLDEERPRRWRFDGAGEVTYDWDERTDKVR